MAVQDAQAEAKLLDQALTELGLTEQPFLENKNRQRFEDAGTQKSRAALEQQVRFGDSLHLLIGDPNSGKTVLLQQLLKHCKNSIKPFVAKGSPEFRANAFLYAVLHDLTKEAEPQAPESITEYVDMLAPIFEQITEDQLAALMIIDDAHLAPIEEIAELVDILQHFENQDGKTARLLLTGTPGLRQSIASFEQQFQDLELNYSTNTMQPLDEARTREYLTSKLHQAGFADSFPFTDKAISKIQQESGGLPGNINHSAARYLNGVYRGEAAGVVTEQKAGFLTSLEWPVLAVGAAALGAIGLGLSMFFGNKSETDIIPVASTDQIEQPVVAPTSVNDSTQIIVQNDSQAEVGQETVVSNVATVGTETNTTGTLVTPTESVADSAIDLVNDAATTIIKPLDNVVESTVAASEEIVAATDDDTRLVLPTTDITETVQSGTDDLTSTTETITVPQLATVEDNAVEKSISTLSGAVSDTSDSVAVEIGQLSDNVQGQSVELGEAIDDVAVATGAGVSVLVEGDTDAAAIATEDNSIALPQAAEPAEGVVVDEPNRAIENERWVLFQSPTKFTVQLATSRERGYIINLAQTMEVQDPVAIYPFLTTNSNNPVFGLLSGLYDTRAEAIAAVENMSDNTKQFGVWIRPVSDLQDDIKRRQ